MIIDVAGAFIYDKDRFLICRRPFNKANGGLWEFAGGKLEPGETAAQAAVRECREELALELSAENDPIAEAVYDNGKQAIRLILIKCRVTGGHMQLLEHSDARWILPADCKNFEFCPADVQLLKQIFPDIRAAQ